MEKIKVFETLETLERPEKLDRYAVERAVLNDVTARGGGRTVADAFDAYAVETDGATFCVADGMAAIENFVDLRAYVGKKKIVALTKERAAETYVLYAYLKPMPNLPPEGVEIKRLAPSLAETVSDALGGEYSAAETAAIMRGTGVYGAIVGGKLAGFIGRSDTGGMDIFRVYEGADKQKISDALVKFLSTLIMTCGRVPFALVAEGDAERRAVFESCGFSVGELFARVVRERA